MPELPVYDTPTLDRRQLLRRGLRLAGGAVALGAAPTLLAACGGSSASSSATTAGASPSTTGTASSSSVASAAASQSTQALNYQLSWVPDVEFAGSYLAETKGYYKANGLAVTLLPGGATVTVEPLVAQGKALIGGSNADTVAQAVAQGAPLKIIGARYQTNPFCIISGASKPIAAPQDMYGKKIGVSAANQAGWKTFVALNKLDLSKITVVPVQFDPTPLADGQVDGWMGYVTSEPTQLTLKGFAVHTMLFADFGYKLFADIYEVSTSTLATKKEELAAFLKAERLGWADDIASPAVGVSAATPYFSKNGLTTAQQTLENNAQIPLISTTYTKANGLFAMNPDDIAANIATMKVAGIQADASLFDSSILAML